MPISWDNIPGPVFLAGNEAIAHRDPAAHYHDGLFRVFHTRVEWEGNRQFYVFTAVTQSRDLIKWSEPRVLTPRDQKLNYSSPGNVVRYGNRWLLCLQTYPTPGGRTTGDETARIYLMPSDDLENWGEPELMRVKGPDVSFDDMGRMIDAYLAQDMMESGKWWCFYKQNGASMSYSYDLTRWTYFGRVDAGENACVLVDEDQDDYILFHSPKNGIGVKRSKNLHDWTDHGLLTLGQQDWPWAAGRITAGHVLDLRNEPEVGRYLMFFHGSVSRENEPVETHGRASLALAWSDDLVHWEWPDGG